MQSGRVGSLNTGISDVSRWRHDDEIHLPVTQTGRVPFLPEQRALDAILKRETLEERLSQFVIPNELSPALGEPNAISSARLAAFAVFQARLDADGGTRRSPVFEAAAKLLQYEDALDQEVQLALAALLRA